MQIEQTATANSRKVFLRAGKGLWITLDSILFVVSDNPQKAKIFYKDLSDENRFDTATLEGNEAERFLTWLESQSLNFSNAAENQRASSPLLLVKAGEIADKILADYQFHGKSDCLRQDIIQSLTAAMATALAE